MLFEIGFLALMAVTTAMPQRMVPHMGAARALAEGDSKKPFTIRTSIPISARANKLIPVVVGGPQDLFVPNSIKAEVGDIIQFQFSNGNHTVTQSAEDQGCTPLQQTDATAIHSGHIPYEAGQETVGTFNMPVTSTDPMFLYCATGPHCQTGQVMVINAASDEQLVNYSKVSAEAAENIDGGEVSGGTVGHIPLSAALFIPAEEEAGPPGGGAAPPAETPASSAATPEATTTATPTSTPTPAA